MLESKTEDTDINEEDELIAAWRTNNRVTTYLIENLPAELWSASIPGSRRTVRTLCAHIHNVRCMWIKMIGAGHGVAVPKNVNALVSSTGRARS